MVAFVKNLGKKVVSLVKPEVKESPDVNCKEPLHYHHDGCPVCDIITETVEVEVSGYEKTTDKTLLKNSYLRGFTKRTLRELKKGKAKVSL